jgi:hypothetical protein
MRWLYLHGFASGPDSNKGTWLARHYAARGVPLERLNLRIPSFEHLRLSRMIAHVSSVIGGPDDRAVLIGSSLGGLTAARVAEADPRVLAVVLLAPAFRIAERWMDRQPAQVESWRASGWLEVDDHTSGGRSRVDWGFLEDALQVDESWPDVRVPTLLIHGTRDDVVTIDYSRSWAMTRPNVHLVEVDDGHELSGTLPRIAAEADAFLAPWLRRVGAGRTAGAGEGA